MKQPLPPEIALEVLLEQGTRQLNGDYVWESLLIRRLLQVPVWDALEIDTALPYPWSIEYSEEIATECTMAEWNDKNLRMLLQSMAMLKTPAKFLAFSQGLTVKILRVV